MTSDSLLHPVGSLPPQVYWRRRALAGVLAVLVLWLAWSVYPARSGASAAQRTAKSGSPASSPASPAAAAPATTTPPVASATGSTTATATTTRAAVLPTVTAPAPVTTAPVTTAPVTTAPITAAPAVPAPVVPATPKCPAAALQVTLTSDHTVYAGGALPHFVLTVTNVSATACRVDVGTSARGFVVTSGTDRIWSSTDCTKSSANVAVFQPRRAVGYAKDWGRQRSSAAGCAAKGTQGRPGTYRVVGHLGALTTAPVIFHLT